MSLNFSFEFNLSLIKEFHMVKLDNATTLPWKI